MKTHYPSHIDQFTMLFTAGIFALLAFVIGSAIFASDDVSLLAIGVIALLLAAFAAFYVASIKARAQGWGACLSAGRDCGGSADNRRTR